MPPRTAIATMPRALGQLRYVISRTRESVSDPDGHNVEVVNHNR